jgi:hypothetical protein|tara:strand:- start:306 stop:530 length:225 start_codon:yes stop_codon:yes gene_type:complete
LYSESSVDVREFPELMPSVPELLKLTSPLIEFNSNVWKLKKDSGISLNTEIPDISIPDELSYISMSLNRMHRII